MLTVMIGPLRERKGATLEIEETVQLPPFTLPTGDTAVGVKAEVTATVTNTGDCFLARGKIRAPLEVTCARCLVPFTYRVETDFLEGYVPEEAAFRGGETGFVLPRHLAAEEGRRQEGDLRTFRGETIDLLPAVREALELAIPIRMLCHPECKGLCPQCGRNLNEGVCACTTKQGDPRWQALNVLRTQESIGEGGGSHGQS